MADVSKKLKAIEGLIRSEPLNYNFSVLDSEIGYAAGYLSGDTILSYDSDGVLTSVTTPISQITLTYDNDGVLEKVEEEFDERIIEDKLFYNDEGVLMRAEREVHVK